MFFDCQNDVLQVVESKRRGQAQAFAVPVFKPVEQMERVRAKPMQQLGYPLKVIVNEGLDGKVLQISKSAGDVACLELNGVIVPVVRKACSTILEPKNLAP